MPKALHELSPRSVLLGIFFVFLGPFLAVELFPFQLDTVIEKSTYLVFHNITEFFSIMVSLSVFSVGWFTYDQSKDRHALFLGTAFLAVGLLDFLHTMSNAAMPAFITPNSTNKSTQFWIAARLFNASAFAVSAFIYPGTQNRWLSKTPLLTIALAATVLLFTGIVFFPDVMPATAIQGVGLTPLKRILEFVVILLLLGAGIAYWSRMKRTGERSLVYYPAAFIICMFSEGVFASYRTGFDTYNVLGHVYKVVAFYLIYRGVFIASVTTPYEMLVNEERERHLASFPMLNPNPVLEVDASGKIIFANPAARAVLNGPGGSDGSAALLPADMKNIIGGMKEIGGKALHREVVIGTRTFAETIQIVSQFSVARIYAYDITDRKRAEERLKDSHLASLNLLEDTIAARKLTDRANARLTILSETASALLASDEPRAVVESLCRKVMSHLDCQLSFNFLVDENARRLHLNAFAGITAEEAKRIEWLDFGTFLCGCVARDGRRIVAEHIPATPDVRTDLVRSYGIKAYCCHPLLGAGGKVLGTLSFGTRSRETFDEADISLMQAVSDQVAVAMMRMKGEQALRESSDRYRTYVEVTGQLGWTTDPEGKVEEDIPSWRAYTGQTYDEIKGWEWSQALHPDDREQAARVWSETVAAKTPYEAEYRIRRYDGIYRYFLARGIPLLNEDGSVREWVGTCIDITDRKLAEEALKKTHAGLELRVEERTRELTIANESVRTERQRLFGVLETLPVYVILLDKDHRIPFQNRFFRERFGASNGRRCYEYLFNRTETCEICETYTVLKTNAPHHWYWTGPDKRDYDIYDYPFIDSNGSTMILEMGIDITDQKKAQEALRETIAELKEATRRSELTTELLTLITQKNTRREYLDATCDLLQSWSRVRHVGVRVTGPNRKIPFESCKGYDPAFLAQEGNLSLAEDECICTRIIAGTPEPTDLQAMTPKGSFYSNDTFSFVDLLSEQEQSRYRGVCMKHQYRSLAVLPILYRGNPVGAVHLADERPGMLPRTTVEFLEQLAQIIGEAIYRFGVEEEQMRLASALESSADGVAITNPKNGTILYVNNAFEKMTGYSREEAVGATLHLLDSGKHDEAFYRELRAALARDGVWRGILMNRKKDGTLYYEECSFSPVREPDGGVINYVSVKRDITEKLRLESIAESVNSMNNIGYIFAGVRHEIGNPVNSAKMMLSVLQMKLETATKEVIKSYVDRSLVEIGRVENLLRNLKNFNLYETPELKNLHLPSFLREFRNLVSEDLKQKSIAFIQNIADDAERARIDPRALQQVLINLVTNAADAVAGRKDPSIELNVRKEPGLVHIEVKDNGAGLTEKQQQDLFKPFYTSKQHGTGLGLVIVKKLLTRMNCGISVTSIPERGTTVNITVPEGSK